MPSFSISSKSIDSAALSSALQNDAAGGFVSFEGWVRNHNEGLAVDALEYEIFHDLALSEGEKLLHEAIEKFNLIDAKSVHREGLLKIGDCAVWIGVSARHRGEAFAACRYIIDEMKHRLPVWKKEFYEGQEPQWVNCQHHHTHAPSPNITEEEFYSRQTRLSQIGAEGQNKLKEAKILVVGVGGLGSASALALAGAGIGTIGLADYDILSASNLHRQIIYNAADIGKPKADLAAARLKELNPFIHINIHPDKVTTGNVEDLFSIYDLILDCTDNFKAKYLLNDAAILCSKPVIQASIYQFEGQLLTIDANDDAGCLRCLFPEPPMPGTVGDCATVGVLGSVPMTFGALQANEAIKKILGIEPSPHLLIFDLLTMQSQKLGRTRSQNCAICGDKRSLQSLPIELELTIQNSDTEESLRQKFLFVDVRENWEVEINPLSDAVHLPTSAFNIELLDAAKEKPLLVICAHGVRSQSAAEYLRQAGWQNAYSLAGGISKLPNKASA